MVKLQAETVAGSRRNAVATFVLRASARVGTAGGHSPVDFASSKAGAGVLIQTVGNSRRGIRRHRTVAGMIEPPLPPLKAFAFGDLEAAFSTRRSIACGVRRTRPACLLGSNPRSLLCENSAPYAGLDLIGSLLAPTAPLCGVCAFIWVQWHRKPVASRSWPRFAIACLKAVSVIGRPPTQGVGRRR